MADPPRETVEVVLVEGDDAPPGEVDGPTAPGGNRAALTSASPRPGGPPAPTRRAMTQAHNVWRRHPVTWTGVVAAVVLSLAAVPVITSARDRARWAALSRVPGVLAPLDGPVAVTWRHPVATGSAVRLVAGRLVFTGTTADGRLAITALDPVTGATAWQTELRAAGPISGWGTCAPPAESSTGTSSGATPLIACVVVDATGTTPTATESFAHPTAARLVVIDATDGAILRQDATDPYTDVSRLGDDLVLSHLDPGYHLTVSRTDAMGTSTRWTFTSPEAAPAGDLVQRPATSYTTGGFVVVDAGGSWLLSGDGRIVPSGSTAVADGSRATVLPDGHTLLRPRQVSDDQGETVVTDLVTGASVTAPGRPYLPAVDDGTIGDAFLTSPSTGEDLRVVDLPTGTVRWTTSGTTSGAAVVLDGRVVRADSGRLRSLDARTGRTVWSTDVGLSTSSPLATDGRIVLVTEPAPDVGTVVDAYSLDDGQRLWRVDVPDGMSLLTLGGHLYGLDGSDIVAFGRVDAEG